MDSGAADDEDDESVFLRYFLFTHPGSLTCSGELLKVSDDVGNSARQRVAF